MPTWSCSLTDKPLKIRPGSEDWTGDGRKPCPRTRSGSELQMRAGSEQGAVLFRRSASRCKLTERTDPLVGLESSEMQKSPGRGTPSRQSSIQLAAVVGHAHRRQMNFKTRASGGRNRQLLRLQARCAVLGRDERCGAARNLRSRLSASLPAVRALGSRGRTFRPRRATRRRLRMNPTVER